VNPLQLGSDGPIISSNLTRLDQKLNTNAPETVSLNVLSGVTIYVIMFYAMDLRQISDYNNRATVSEKEVFKDTPAINRRRN
jgi:hypothetical protein